MPLLCLYYFARISRRDPDFRLASAYLFSTILIYVQTLSNPYLNNPIGLSFVLIALFSLRTISRASTASMAHRRRIAPLMPREVQATP